MSSVRYHYLIKERPDDSQAFLKKAFSSQQKFLYMKSGKMYRVHCSQCDTTEEVDYNMLKHIKYSCVCPFCFFSIKPTHSAHAYIDTYVKDYNDGFEVIAEYDLNEGFINDHYYHCLTKVENEWYRRGIIRTMSGYLGCYQRDYGDEDWRKQSHKSNGYYIDYADYFINTYSDRQWKLTKREYLSELDEYNIKSNQKYLAMHNHYSKNQIGFIRKFDLKTDEEVMKYSNYFEQYSGYNWNKRFEGKAHNVYLLDYLWRNNIPYTNYEDYMEQCDKLGYKPDKPKDFQKAHERLSNELKAIEEKEKCEKANILIKAFADTMPHYSSKQFDILPFKSAEEILAAASEFHNCMFSIYLMRYAERKTDLYRCLVNGELYACIEVCNGHVEQIRGKYNRSVDMEKKIKRAICNQLLATTNGAICAAH